MGQKKVSMISEVSLFQGLNCMQELFLGKEKVSLLERCPLHCTQELLLGGRKGVFIREVSSFQGCP